jgi:hypothetical protein
MLRNLLCFSLSQMPAKEKRKQMNADLKVNEMLWSP